MFYNIDFYLTQILSTSAALTQALEELLIFTSYHFPTLGSSGVDNESMIITFVPSWMGTTFSFSPLLDLGAELRFVVGTITTAESCLL